MKTFALKNGDLSLNGSSYAMVSGVDRVKQQLGLGVREHYGSDRFHTRWGSVLPEWIGTVSNRQGIEIELRSEVLRVIKNFVTAQTAAIDARAVRGLSAVQAPNEVVVGVNSVTVEQQADRMIIRVSIRTAGGQDISLTTAPGGNDGNAR